MTARMFLNKRGRLKRKDPVRDAKTAQLRGEVTRKNPERDFQKQLVQHLRIALPPNVFMTAFPAGGGGKIRGAQLKAAGLVPGVPDLLFVYQGRAYWMELKAAKGVVSPAQRDCWTLLSRAGCNAYMVIRTLTEAFKALDGWNIPTRIKQDIAA